MVDYNELLVLWTWVACYNEFSLGEIFPSPIEDSLATFNPADL